MTADPHHAEQGPGRPLGASLAASTPVAGASRRPEGSCGPQAGADSFAPYRQLLAHLQAARSKALHGGTRCRLDEAGWVNDGIAIAYQAAIAWAITLFEGHEAREVYLAAEGETARTTPDNGAVSGDAADNPLREQYAAALWQAAEFNTIAEWICCEPLNPRHELCAQGYAAMRMIKALIVDDPEAAKPAPLADAVLAVREREIEQLRARIVTLEHVAAGNKRHVQLIVPDLQRAEATIARVRALHQPDLDGRTGYQPDDDDTPGAYGDIAQACRECGSSDLAVRWPCPTVRALDAELVAANPGEQYATRAAAIRDQSALAQIRLHIAAHRPRLQLADPILLGRLDAVLRQVGELEAAGGEGA